MSQERKLKPPVLRAHEEEEILHYVIEKARKNETVRRGEVIEMVVKFIKSDNRKNPFRNGTPGDKWFSLFRRRHNTHFLNLEREQLKIAERIGFTEKVMNTVTYKANSVVKRQMPSLDSAWSPYTPKRKRKPKLFKEYVSSSPYERVSSSTPLNTPPLSHKSVASEMIPSPAITASPSITVSPAITASPVSDESSNLNTDDGDKSQESQGDSTDFQPGIKLEVMDFNDDKWYPVKVVEVDYEEGEVLVHFEKWSNRYDEWVRMDSNRIRRPRLPSSNASKKVFVENEKVIAVWAYNHKYPATIRKVLPNDKYEVLFCDGYAKILRGCKLFKATEDDLKNIQLPPPKKPAPPMGADPLDPDLGPKEERRLKKRRMDVYEALRPQKKNRSDNMEGNLSDVKTEPRSASPSPTRTPTTSKPKESFRVVLKGAVGPSEDDSEDEDDGWVEDNDDSDQGSSVEAEQKKRRKKKKKVDGRDEYFPLKIKLQKDREEALAHWKKLELEKSAEFQRRKYAEIKRRLSRIKQVIKRSNNKARTKLSEKTLQEKRFKERERIRKYRAKLSEEQLQKKREYDRQYKLKRKEAGTWKLRKDMNEREKRRDRKLVRERVKRCRERKKLQRDQNLLSRSINFSMPLKDLDASAPDNLRVSNNKTTQRPRKMSNTRPVDNLNSVKLSSSQIPHKSKRQITLKNNNSVGSKQVIKKSNNKPRIKLSEKALQEKRFKERERQRKHRAKLSEEQLEKRREYNRQYKLKRKEAGTWKLRKDMNEREKRKDRELVRERVKRCRERKKLQNERKGSSRS